jgi:hypothetical protein
MLDHPRPRRSPARFLAPLALLVAIAITYGVVHHALGGGSRHVRAHTTSRARHGSRSTSRHTAGTQKPKYYVVKPGDNLSVISAHTGVPLPTLQSLNPNAASGALQVGQRLRLR